MIHCLLKSTTSLKSHKLPSPLFSPSKLYPSLPQEVSLTWTLCRDVSLLVEINPSFVCLFLPCLSITGQTDQQTRINKLYDWQDLFTKSTYTRYRWAEIFQSVLMASLLNIHYSRDMCGSCPKYFTKYQIHFLLKNKSHTNHVVDMTSLGAHAMPSGGGFVVKFL